MAKYISVHSKHLIFSSLYAFAPDNLAWLWAFFDWEMELDLEQIETQDSFSAFKTATTSFSANSNHHDNEIKVSEEEIYTINKIFSESPLVKYVYRGNFEFISIICKIGSLG